MFVRDIREILGVIMDEVIFEWFPMVFLPYDSQKVGVCAHNS